MTEGSELAWESRRCVFSLTAKSRAWLERNRED